MSRQEAQRRATEPPRRFQGHVHHGNGRIDGTTDQWRVYQHIVHRLEHGPYLRLMVQAAAGTGKSYLLVAVCLWCLLRAKKFRAAAPTGIAAANIEVPNTDIAATTIHTLFDFNTEFKTKRDFSNMDDELVQVLLQLGVLLLDEVSMIDDEFWQGITDMLCAASSLRGAGRQSLPDELGQVHVLLFGDFRQLPPATNRPPFIVLPAVHTCFRFAVLRENRRLARAGGAQGKELEDFHQILTDISNGIVSEQVREFVVKKYTEGALVSAANVDFEGSTTVVSKRRFRDKWNRAVVRRLSKVSQRSLRVKALLKPTYSDKKVLAFYSDKKAKSLQKKARSVALWNLQLAGHWNKDTPPDGGPKHLMRCMLVSNVDVRQRFANGTQGRLYHWYPRDVQKRKHLRANHPDLLARFVKESAYSDETKKTLIAEVDFMDIQPRPTPLAGIAATSMVQLQLVPSYALTCHKVQALTIKHVVRACLEGIFAWGSVYVMFSRVTDPRNLRLVGLPPYDLLDDVAQEWFLIDSIMDICLIIWVGRIGVPLVPPPLPPQGCVGMPPAARFLPMPLGGSCLGPRQI